MIDDMMRPGFSPRFVGVEAADWGPSVLSGFLGTFTGGEPSEFPVSVLVTDRLDCLVDVFGVEQYAEVMRPFQTRSVPAEAREADRIMSVTSVLRGAAVPVAKETDARIVLCDLDRTVQQMLGWRDHLPAAPGLPTLKIPPRTKPEGWVARDGVIQKMVPASLYMAPWFFDFGRPSVSYKETLSSFRDQYLCNPLARAARERSEAEGLLRAREDEVFTGMVAASDAIVTEEPVRSESRKNHTRKRRA